MKAPRVIGPRVQVDTTVLKGMTRDERLRVLTRAVMEADGTPESAGLAYKRLFAAAALPRKRPSA